MKNLSVHAIFYVLGCLLLINCTSVSTTSPNPASPVKNSTIGARAMISRDVGSGFYKTLPSNSNPDAILRSGEIVVIIQNKGKWTKVENAERGAGWVLTNELEVIQ